ncbi:MAG: phosphatidate cytidylyltransferase, partial [Bacteroidetes bacterium 4484_249]
PLSLLNVLFYPHIELSSPTYELVLGFFILIWTNDTFAYLTGMLFGRHKFFERISPKKTWEGTIGGAVFAIIGAYILSLVFQVINPIEWIGFVLTLIIFGTFGDLIESMFKRTINVKDSGGLMPGHGGILDRLDSILIAAPFVIIYVVFVIN